MKPKTPEPDGYCQKFDTGEIDADTFTVSLFNDPTIDNDYFPVYFSTEPPVPKEVYSEFDVRKHVLHPESYIALGSGEIKVSQLKELLEWVELIREGFKKGWITQVEMASDMLLKLEAIVPGGEK